MKYLIGIDIGTGSTKAVALDATGKILHSEHVAYPTLTPQPQFSEQAPEIIWQAFIKCVARTIAHLRQQPEALAISSAMHSLLAVDGNGNPLMNMITWADNRSADIATKIRNSSKGEMLYEQTGTPVHAMSPLCKIIWLRENMPETFQTAAKFISIKEYIWFKLFGTFEVDHSIASATGLFDILSLQWNDNALSLCQLSVDKLSAPVSTSFHRKNVLGNVAALLNIAAGIPFVIGGSDGCMANLGSMAIKPGTAALTIGTSGAIRVANASPTYNFAGMNFNYRLDEETFISGGPINNGGVILKWYVQQFLKRELITAEDYYEVLNDLQVTPPGSDGLIFLPYLLGERAPIWNSDSCGVFFGIQTRHTQEHFTRAVLEGICMALFHIGNGLEESGLLIDKIHVSGGFVRSHDWLQLLADIFGKPIVLVSHEDASAIGAIYIAMKSLSIISSYDELLPKSPLVFKPQMEHHKVYLERNFPLYKNLYKNLMLDMAIWSEQQNAEVMPDKLSSDTLKS
jgi:gluconokinase